jgi:hypothetical protein
VPIYIRGVIKLHLAGPLGRPGQLPIRADSLKITRNPEFCQQNPLATGAAHRK